MFAKEHLRLMNYLAKERLSEIDELIEISDESDIKELISEQETLKEISKALSNDIL